MSAGLASGWVLRPPSADYFAPWGGQSVSVVGERLVGGQGHGTLEARPAEVLAALAAIDLLPRDPPDVADE